ncbi:MAG: mandelate racemase/muconate lactonizing enzyme family protein [Planctomycetes bacterium]|nr:mandelate racemase/muconate lactonizing enzyme family protein [Planctomycetota bacterium]
MPRYRTVNRITRRDLMKAGLLTSAGLLAPKPWMEHSRAATWHTSDKWFRVQKVNRTTVKMPYRETSGRNMARELPHWKWTEVMEVELSSGVTGFGETLLYYTWGVPDDADIRRVLGQNAFEVMWNDELGAGLQMALFDAVAKTSGIPIHALLGPKVHETTPVAWWNIDTSAEDMASECAEAHRQGYRAYKSKGRPWYDVWAQVEAVAKAVPESFHVALDFNDTLLDAERGIPILKELEQYPQVAIWETPIFQSDIKGNQAIRRECRAPVAMHYGNPDPLVAIREDVCDGFVVGHGARELLQTGAVAAMADKPFWLQLVGTGITAAWSLQFGGALTHATWPAVNCHQLYEHSLLVEPIKIEDGFAKVPDGVGLGVELNRDMIERFRVDKPQSRPDPPRLIETTWSDGRRMYIANNGKVNFMLTQGQQGTIPYFEHGVDSKLVPNDGSTQWKELYAAARKGPHFVEA